VNFAIFSRHATGVRLRFIDHLDDSVPTRTILLAPARKTNGGTSGTFGWRGSSGQLYGFRFAGPYAPHEGDRFNPNTSCGPYATAIALVPGCDFLPFSLARFFIASEDLSFSETDDAATGADQCIVTMGFDWRV